MVRGIELSDNVKETDGEDEEYSEIDEDDQAFLD